MLSEKLCSDFLEPYYKYVDDEVKRNSARRMTKALQDSLVGYTQDPKQIISKALFDFKGNTNLIHIKNIRFHSLCEHHILPFWGVAHIFYIPNTCVIGLSKVPRVVDCFSKRLQLQEKLTYEIANTLYLHHKFNPKGVAVCLTARHFCMEMRGVSRQSYTTTYSFNGEFENVELQKRVEQQVAGEIIL